jgi:SAM-dependent methyltransferase
LPEPESPVSPPAKAAEPTSPETSAETDAPGLDRELAEYVLGFCQSSAATAGYAAMHLRRFVHTIEITPPGTAADRILEMGAYLQITPALATKLGYGEVRGGYLGPLGKTDQREVRSAQGELFRCPVDLFDAEKDAFPYPEHYFATVLCCELIEHLATDPMHMMAEINRVLRPGGHLVLSTPNVCSHRAIGAALLGYHPGLFHQYIRPGAEGGTDPRHSREFAPVDIQYMFEAAGFSVVRLETGPYGDESTAQHLWVERLLERYYLPAHLRGDAIFAVGRKESGVRERYPAWLYAGGE